MKEARRKVKQLLASFAERCAEADISFNVLQDAGLPYEEILRESQRYDLVLFGHETHFRFGTVDRPDETLWKVLKRGPRPVVIAPPKLERGFFGSRRLQRESASRSGLAGVSVVGLGLG